jgi:predicted Zn-dependent protease
MTMRRTLLIALLLAAPLHAHEGLHEQIAAVTRAIAREPRNAALHLKRGELHRLHREWDNAARDYDRAQQLDRELHAVDLARGRMLFESGRVRESIAPLQRYTRSVPRDAHGHIALARALRGAGRTSEAIPEFEAALAAHFDPDLALEYAAILDRPRALRYLDTLPPLVTLQRAAIDLELGAGNLEGALRRVDAAMASAARKEEWLERRGDILMKLGRAAEARAAYQSALDAIATLPPERRRSRAITAMEQRLRRRV